MKNLRRLLFNEAHLKWQDQVMHLVARSQPDDQVTDWLTDSNNPWNGFRISTAFDVHGRKESAAVI